ncbi:alpha/beta fold hydrolase [Tundrisphaera sp. TA3]|uniref:alpha/beta fold hydrolase n=1 Tax=Tundrisphaera sp. TA3 TaxID=3435775 RepID=UPI003EB9A770
MRRRAILLAAVTGILAVGAAWARARQATVPEGVAFEPDITYATAGGEALRLDLARPQSGDGPFPLVVCIHGGGWQAGSKADFRTAAFGLAQQGFAAASVQYRLAPRHPFPAQYDDVKAAVAALRERAKEWKIDPDRVAVLGGSAGGHLALMLATDPALKIKAAVSLAGPTDLTRSFPEETDRIVRTLIGPDAPDPAEARRLASPIRRVGPGVAPILMIHGDQDEIVPYDQSTTMRDAYRGAGLDAELLTIRGGKHGGGGSAEDGASAILKAVEFLRSHLKAGP